MITVTSQSENKHDRYGLQREGGRAGGRARTRRLKDEGIQNLECCLQAIIFVQSEGGRHFHEISQKATGLGLHT